MSATTFAAVAVTVYAAHQVADHVFGQTDKQAACKAGSGWAGWRALAGHVVAYHVVLVVMLAAAVAALRLDVTTAGLVAGVVFSAVTHAVLDRRWPVRWILQVTRSPEFAERMSPICGMYLADQSLHVFCLWISALLIAVI